MTLPTRLNTLANVIKQAASSPDKFRNDFVKKFPGSVKEPNYGEFTSLIIRALELPSGTTVEQVCSELEASGFKKLTNVYPALGTINQTGVNYEKDGVRSVVNSSRGRTGLIFYQDKPKKTANLLKTSSDDTANSLRKDLISKFPGATNNKSMTVPGMSKDFIVRAATLPTGSSLEEAVKYLKSIGFIGKKTGKEKWDFEKGSSLRATAHQYDNNVIVTFSQYHE